MPEPVYPIVESGMPEPVYSIVESGNDEYGWDWWWAKSVDCGLLYDMIDRYEGILDSSPPSDMLIYQINGRLRKMKEIYSVTCFEA